MQVVIVGGGMGGLATALALERSRAFEHIAVYEQSRRKIEVGAGILLQPNGARILHELGVDLRGDVGLAAVLCGGRSWTRTNEVLFKPLDQDGYGDGAGFHHMHRSDLLKTMQARVAEKAPTIAVHAGKRLVALEQDCPRPGRVTTAFEDGTTAEADVVIGADGINSKVLGLQWPNVARRRWTEVSCFRGLIPRAKVLELNLSTPTPDPRGLTVDTRSVPGGACFSYWIRRGELLNIWVGLHEPGADPFEREESDHFPIAHEDMQRRAAQIFEGDPRGPDVLELLGAMEDPVVWGIYDRDQLEHWQEGRVALMGDAAHPMLPTMGQGVNQCFEDAGALGRCFELHGADVQSAFLHYERVRHFRAGRFQYMSRFIFKSCVPPRSERLEKLLKELNERDAPAWSSASRPGEDDSWIYGFDARDVGLELPKRKLGPWDFRTRSALKGEQVDDLWNPPRAPFPSALLTRAEVAAHCTLEDSWVIIHNRVYDFSEWNTHHPGGTFVSKLYAGKDVSAEFGDFHSPAALAHMELFFVSELAKEDQPSAQQSRL